MRSRKKLNINYLQVVVCDRDNVSLIDFFPDFYWFIERAFKGDYVHSVYP